MTLIVGVKCNNGIVIGADSASTNTTSTGQQTAMQPTKKLDIIDDNIIVGISGSVGLAQFFKEEVEKLWKNNAFSNKGVEEARIKITGAFRTHLIREAKFAQDSSNMLGRLHEQEIISHTLIAMPVKKNLVLLEFPATGSSEEKKEAMPTVAIGCAQPIADPFLYFLRRVFWPDRLPSLVEGKIAAYWALDYSIKASPANVGFPVKIAILEKKGSDIKAYELPKEELTYLGNIVDEAEKYLKRYEAPSAEEDRIEIPKPEKK
ncbi:MAG: hypothetical protein KAJ66_01325 [Candidatus Omnitrophica bacterium]|nr:hypothetical protein [Candidatus Omnitrophota bacterium]